MLKVIVAQETTRKLGFAIQYDEEKVGARLEALQSQLSIPTQYKASWALFEFGGLFSKESCICPFHFPLSPYKEHSQMECNERRVHVHDAHFCPFPVS